MAEIDCMYERSILTKARGVRGRLPGGRSVWAVVGRLQLRMWVGAVVLLKLECAQEPHRDLVQTQALSH